MSIPHSLPLRVLLCPGSSRRLGGPWSMWYWHLHDAALHKSLLIAQSLPNPSPHSLRLGAFSMPWQLAQAGWAVKHVVLAPEEWRASWAPRQTTEHRRNTPPHSHK